MSVLKLVVFDVDGTLVDSQGDILRAMEVAFASEGRERPRREEVLGVVGLSLEVIFPRLCPDLDPAAHGRMVEAYKAEYMALRARSGSVRSSPLYPGARPLLDHLRGQPDVLMGVATGKSRRGLETLIAGHGLEGYFVTRQVADFHPSKPHPSMLIEAMAETGIPAERTVMVGDTRFDMEMAAAAGVRAIGVSWGYHPRSALTAADLILERFEDLPAALEESWSVKA